MKKMRVICRDCGHEEVTEVMSQEEAREKNIRLVRATCKRCGSTNVIMRD